MTLHKPQFPLSPKAPSDECWMFPAGLWGTAREVTSFMKKMTAKGIKNETWEAEFRKGVVSVESQFGLCTTLIFDQAAATARLRASSKGSLFFSVSLRHRGDLPRNSPKHRTIRKAVSIR